MSHDVFISHSSKDKQAADAICHALENSGIKCWIAPRDVTPGSEYAEELIKGIKYSKVFLLIFSRESNVSKPVSKEIESAFRYEKTVIPFRIEDVEMRESLEYYLSNLHWLDAFPDDKEFDSLVKVVRNTLGISAPPAPPPPEPAPAPEPQQYTPPPQEYTPQPQPQEQQYTQPEVQQYVQPPAYAPAPAAAPLKSNMKFIAIAACAVVLAAAIAVGVIVFGGDDSVPAGGIRETAEVQLWILGKWVWTIDEGDMSGSRGFCELLPNGEFYTQNYERANPEWGMYLIDGLNITLNYIDGGQIQRGVITYIDDDNFSVDWSGLHSNYVGRFTRVWAFPDITAPIIAQPGYYALFPAVPDFGVYMPEAVLINRGYARDFGVDEFLLEDDIYIIGSDYLHIYDLKGAHLDYVLEYEELLKVNGFEFQAHTFSDDYNIYAALYYHRGEELFTAVLFLIDDDECWISKG
jgi:hypothetical protein